MHVDERLAVTREVGQVAEEDAGAVVVRVVARDLGHRRVLDLEAHDVAEGLRVADDHVLRLAHVEARVLGVAHLALLDEHVRRLRGVDAIAAVLGVGPAGPGHRHVAQRDLVRLLDADRLPRRVLHGEVLDGEPIADAGDAVRSAQLPGEVEHGAPLLRAAQLDVGLGDGELIVERVGPGGEADHVPRLRRADRALHQIVRGVGVGHGRDDHGAAVEALGRALTRDEGEASAEEQDPHGHRRAA